MGAAFEWDRCEPLPIVRDAPGDGGHMNSRARAADTGAGFSPTQTAHPAGTAPTLTFLVPTYNESECPLFQSLTALVRAQSPPHAFEILVIDDSSSEHERQVQAAIERVRAELPGAATIRMLRGPRVGKGAAVRLGALTSTGDVVFIVDADIPISLQHVKQFVDLLANGADIIVPERPLFRNVKLLRRIMSIGLFVIQSTFVFHGHIFTDTQCGFKAFRGDVLRALANAQIVERGMYDLEYLYMTVQAGLVIRRVPVEPNPEVRESRINLWNCLRFDPYDILRMKAHGVMQRLRGRRLVVKRTSFFESAV
jgi:glycosyltransferase involved in cell wall biosynthesis